MYDVAIIGAGPAGATLARLIAACYRVLLVEKRRLPSSGASNASRKCCGGLLAPDAQAMLSRMGLGLPKSVLVDPQLFVVRAIDMQRRIERYYQRYYINMDRQKFDCWLLSMVPSNVDIRLGCQFKSYESENEYLRINLVEKSKACVERARILVGADGAMSRARKLTLPNHPSPRAYLGVQEWVEADSKLPYFCTIFDQEITDYYCWTIPKENELIIGAALCPGRDVPAKFMLLKTKLRDYGFQFGRPIRKKAAFILRPTKTKQISTGANAVGLLGEAAGWISPSSAEGLSYALRSALVLAQVLRNTPENFEEGFRRKTAQMRRNIFFKNIKSQFIYNPLLRQIVMRTGIKSMQIYGC